MNYKHKLSGLKRTKWENKTSHQKKQILQEHYENLGYKLPQYLTSNKEINEKQLQSALNKVSRGYTSRSTPTTPTKITVQQKYDKAVQQYNKKAEKFNLQLDKLNLSDLEKNYIKGKSINLPKLRQKPFKKDDELGIEIANVKIKNKEAMKEEINRIKNETKKLKSVIDDITNNVNKMGTLYDTRVNDKKFKQMLDSDVFLSFSDEELEILEQHYNALTDFQKEIFMKVRFSDLRDRYKILFEDNGLDEGDMSPHGLYNGILYGIKNSYYATTGKDLFVGKSGKRY